MSLAVIVVALVVVVELAVLGLLWIYLNFEDRRAAARRRGPQRSLGERQETRAHAELYDRRRFGGGRST